MEEILDRPLLAHSAYTNILTGCRKAAIRNAQHATHSGYSKRGLRISASPPNSIQRKVRICSGRKFASKFLLHGVDLGFQAAAWPGPVIDLDLGFNPVAVRPHCLETGSHDGHHFGPFAFDDGTHGSKLIR